MQHEACALCMSSAEICLFLEPENDLRDEVRPTGNKPRGEINEDDHNLNSLGTVGE